jgi:hypothetical protein
MLFEVENRRYEIITASDVIRDGLGCELWDADKNQMLVEIFRNDNLKKIQFNSSEMDVPFEVIEKLIKTFEERVGREFQD